MKTVVFHLQAKTCEKEIERLKEEAVRYKINVEEKELSEVKEEKDRILALTDWPEDVCYAQKYNIAVIFYEAPGTKSSVSGVDLILQGLEEVDMEYLQLVYMRHHGLPWVIAKTERICIRESIEGDLPAFRNIYREKGMLDYLPDPEFEGEAGREKFQQYIHNMYRFYNYGIWTLIERKSGAVIGRVGIENGEYQGKNVLEIGYLLGKRWRKQGFAREAVQMAERFAAEVLQAKNLYAFIHPNNQPSIDLVRDSGYERLEDVSHDRLQTWRKKLQKD